MVEIATDDLFRTQEVILKNFHGWYVVTFNSATDYEFDATFGDAYDIHDAEPFKKPQRDFDINDPRR